MNSNSRLIALALMLHGWALADEAPPAPAPWIGPGSEWDWETQSDFFREKFGGPDAAPLWSQTLYDPRPADEESRTQELTLPMPCGGAMVFRRIEVGGNRGWLGEQQIELGSGDDDPSPHDDRRLEHISGTFTGDGSDLGAGRSYYLGKYEVTKLQYRVLTEACPQRLDGRRPAVEVSWYDAVDFTRRYTEWLYQNAPEQLPQEDGVRAYLRLPTEVEWEYAARGGLAVDSSEFREPVFPTGQGSIDDYAWIRESVASSFEPRPVGALLPNPLGLYDILGNASELIFDLFRLSARGRMHAQPGGFLVKGAHFRTWRKAVRSGWRREHPHFNPVTGVPNRLDTVGFRVAISAPVLTSEQRIKAIRQALIRLPSEPLRLDAEEPYRDLAAEVRTSLGAMQADLERCLATPERLPALSFPSPQLPLVRPPAELPIWSQLWDTLPSMDTREIRQHGLWFLQKKHPDKALTLFKQAVARGDGWSAFVIGAMYDPSESEAGDFGHGHGRQQTVLPSAVAATCWYRLAQNLGEKRAGLRIKTMQASKRGAAQENLSESMPTIADCEQVTPRLGTP